ncbi:hypothetical protein ACHAXS_004289 [Conticribra weissflogii]
MAAIQTMTTEISPSSLPSSSTLKRSPYLSSTCHTINNHNRNRNHKNHHLSRRSSSVSSHSSRPTGSHAYELRRPTPGATHSRDALAFHPYVTARARDNHINLADSSSTGRSQSSAASSEIAGNHRQNHRQRHRHCQSGGGKISNRQPTKRGAISTACLPSSVGGTPTVSPSSSSTADLPHWDHPSDPFHRVHSLLAGDAAASSASAESDDGDCVPLADALSRIGIGIASSSTSPLASSSSPSPDETNGADVGIFHGNLSDWMQRHYHPSRKRSDFFRTVLDPMDGPSCDVNKAVRNALWREISPHDESDDSSDSSLASDGNGIYEVLRRSFNKSGSSSRDNLCSFSSFQSASRISFSSISSFTSRHPASVLWTNAHYSKHEEQEIEEQHEEQQQEEQGPTTTKTTPITATHQLRRRLPSKKRRSSSHAGLAYGTEFCREGHGSFVSLSRSFSFACASGGGVGSVLGTRTGYGMELNRSGVDART